MPAIKQPCPHCGKWIMRDVAACPFCGRADPFAPGRCPNCRAIIEDPAWVACPSCGTSLREGAPEGGAAGVNTASPGVTAPVAPSPAPPAKPEAPPADAAAAARCSGCGSPLPAGARFCAVCGTLVG